MGSTVPQDFSQYLVAPENERAPRISPEERHAPNSAAGTITAFSCAADGRWY